MGPWILFAQLVIGMPQVVGSCQMGMHLESASCVPDNYQKVSWTADTMLPQTRKLKTGPGVVIYDDPDGTRVECADHEETARQRLKRLRAELRAAELAVIAERVNAAHDRKAKR